MQGEANRNYDLLFDKPEEEPRRITKEIKKLMVEEKSYKEIENFLQEKYGNQCFLYSYLDELINQLTADDSQYNIADLIDTIHDLPIMKKAYIRNNRFYFTTDKGTMVLSSANKYIDSKISEKYKTEKIKHYQNIEKELDKRECHCHALSKMLLEILYEDLNIDCKIVTGYPSYYTKQNNYLHSWIELEENGEVYVIDSTMNVIINKEGYYQIKNLEEENIVSKIDAKTVIDDFKKYQSILTFKPENYYYFDDEDEKIDERTSIDIKTYLTSRDLLIKDLERNFKKTNEGEER